jgi:hypothetical protein
MMVSVDQDPSICAGFIKKQRILQEVEGFVALLERGGGLN